MYINKIWVITKPVIAWCTGTCTGMFKHEVQFDHADAMAPSKIEINNCN